MSLSPDQSRFGEADGASFGKKPGTSRYFTGLGLYGAWLNRARGKLSAMHAKPSMNVEHYSGDRRPIWAQRKERWMSNVFVLDTNKQPLNPVHAGRALAAQTRQSSRLPALSVQHHSEASSGAA